MAHLERAFQFMITRNHRAFHLAPILALPIGLAILVPQASGQARDPHLVWRTIHTPHFDIHYHEPLGVMARQVAGLCERAQDRLGPLLKYKPGERVQVVLTDSSASANGSATVLPRNEIRLLASAPQDLTALNDHDNWMDILVTHEHTHIAHLDTISGIPALLNAIFGKLFAPNAVQPRWFIEGIAVLEESLHTTGGRLRSSIFDMYLRADALENRIAELDELSHDVLRWPHGNIWYLYGSHFVRHIFENFGHGALTRMSLDYGGQTIPYGLNRVAKRATGKTFVELYEDFKDHLVTRSERTRDAVQARGRVEGQRVTFHGERCGYPQYLNENEVLYWASNGRDLDGIYRLHLRTGERKRVVRTLGTSYVALGPKRTSLYYNTLTPSRDIYRFNEIFTHDLRTGRTDRLTTDSRSRAPAMAPDGTHLAHVSNTAGTTHLVLSKRQGNELHEVRTLVNNARFDQVYTPRWSPDGQFLAYSQWKRGGYRDIHVMHVPSGKTRPITSDRWVDTGPAWGPDGHTLYFSSDRTGIANIYVHDLRSGDTQQVTNVVNGAFQPSVSDDGKELIYVGYTTYGFDLYTLPLAKRYQGHNAPEQPPRKAYTPLTEDQRWISKPYAPWKTLGPRAYTVEFNNTSFGRQLRFETNGNDVVGLHSYIADVGVGLDDDKINANLVWTYRGLQAPVRLSLFHSMTERNDLIVAGAPREWTERRVGGSLSASYPILGQFHRNDVSIGYSWSYLTNAEPFGGRLDPNDPPPILPERGSLAAVSGAWSFSNVARTRYDVTPSFGTRAGIGFSAAHRTLGSQFNLLTADWSATQYVENPWIDRNVLAIRYTGAWSFGDELRRPRFGIGGFPEGPSLFEVITDTLQLDGVALRGFPPFFRVGTQFHLTQFEYRFPILQADNGVSLLPAYFNRVWGLLFTDMGTVSDGLPMPTDLRLGIGGELLFEFTLGYFSTYSLRFGMARGLGDDGEFQFYANFGVPFR